VELTVRVRRRLPAELARLERRLVLVSLVLVLHEVDRAGGGSETAGDASENAIDHPEL
jgi:hypothetical protein